MPEDGPGRERTVRKELAPLAVAAVPLVVAVLHLYVVEARGDVDTFSAIVSSANLSAVWVSVVLSTFLATAPILFLVPWTKIVVLPALSAYDNRRNRLAGTAKLVVGILLAAALEWLTKSDDFLGDLLFYAFFAIVVAFILGLYSGIVWISNREDGERLPKEFELVQKLSPWMFVALFVGAGLLSSSPGFPYEVVRVRGEADPSAGYVISVDDTSLTLLYNDLDRGGGLRRVPTGDVEGRFVCARPSPVSPQSTYPTGLEMLLDRFYDKPLYVPDQCVYQSKP